MKINGVNNINKIMSIYAKNQSVNSTKNTSFKEDKIEISQSGKDFQTALDAFKNLPEVRSEKVDNIKQKVDSGNYNVDMENLARAMMGRRNNV